MNIDSANNVPNQKIIPIKEMNQNNVPEAYDIEGMGNYIKKNIRLIINEKDSEYFKLPQILDDTLEKVFIYKENVDGNQAIRLALEGPDRSPIALTLAEGDYEQICSKVDHKDFVEDFVNKVNRSKKYFEY